MRDEIARYTNAICKIREFSPNMAVKRTQVGYSDLPITRVRERYSPEARTNENVECVLLLSDACCSGTPASNRGTGPGCPTNASCYVRMIDGIPRAWIRSAGLVILNKHSIHAALRNDVYRICAV